MQFKVNPFLGEELEKPRFPIYIKKTTFTEQSRYTDNTHLHISALGKLRNDADVLSCVWKQ